MHRDILHLHVPAFSVAVARLGDAALRQRPIAVALPGARGTVLSVSAEARAAGVGKGMTAAWALRVCPGLRVVPPVPEASARVQCALLALAQQYTPQWEPLRPGHLFLDLSGGSRLFGPARDVAARIEREVGQQLGLAGSVGVGGSKLVSRVASLFLAHGGVCDVLRGTEPGFLAPLPLDLLPGLGVARRQTLEDWGVRCIGEVGALPPGHLRAVFGPFGAVLRARAAGEDWEPVQPPARAPEVRESEALAQDSALEAWLLGRLRRLLERACGRLRRAQQVAGRMEVRLRYADGREVRRGARLPSPSGWEHELYHQLRELFLHAFQRRVRVRWLGLVLSRLAAASLQLDLFRPPQHDRRREALGRALDAIRARHGFDAVRWGDGLPAS